jgi:2-polyprenyl-6-hydroxyphenyl methylase/3-demethylubiquinone-9 3-methyltransferase
MKIGDKSSEVHDGIPLSVKAPLEAPDRIGWICQRVQGSTILDIGCSQGIVSILLARAGKKVIGIDVDGDAIEYAREELTAESGSTRKLITLIHGDALQQAFEENSFDTVIVEQLIEYTPDPEALLDLASNLCKSNGRIIITTPFGLPGHPDYERTCYLYRFIILVSSFCIVKELDIVSKYIVFSGEPQKEKNTGPARTPVISEELHRRIHQLSEREFEQLEIAHHITLLARSNMVTALQGRIDDIKSDKQALQSTMESLKHRIEGLRSDRQTLQDKIVRLRNEHSQKIEAIRASVSFQVGEALVRAVRPSKATITLPLRLWRIYQGYKSKQSPS